MSRTAVLAALLFLPGGTAVAWAPAPEKADTIQPGDRLYIHVVPESRVFGSIKGVYRVEPSGKVALGPGVGRVQLKGLTLEQAEDEILKHVGRLIKDPQVQVTRYDPVPESPLEERVRQLEKEVHMLREAVEQLRKKPRD